MRRRALAIVFGTLFLLAENDLHGRQAGEQSIAQMPDLPQEQVRIQVNTQLLFTGEVLYFSANTINRANQLPLNFSKVLYLELVDFRGESVMQTAIRLQDASGDGQLYIPSGFSTGNYSLIAYTQWMRNDGPEYFEQQIISVINPFKSLRSGGGVELNSELQMEHQPDVADESLAVKGARDRFRKRELVQLALDNRSAELQELTISVHRLLPAYFAPSKADKTNPQGPSSINTYLPELRGQVVSGTLITKASREPEGDKLIYLSEPGRDYQLYVARTDEKGRFNVLLDPTYNKSGLVLQTDGNEEEYEFVLDEPFIDDHSYFKAPQLQLNPMLENYLEERLIDLQIENIYYPFQKEEELTIVREPFYEKADRVVFLDEYTRFTVMEEVIRELVGSVFLRREEGQQIFKVRNYGYNNLVFDQQPLVVVDGIPVFDTEITMSLNPLDYQRIEIAGRKYYYGPTVFYGIVNFYSYEGDHPGIDLGDHAHPFEFIGLQPRKTPYAPDYSDDVDSRLPDRRRQLHWEPNILIRPGDSRTVEFYTSDLPGTYEILIRGTGEDGKTTFHRSVFEVESGQL